MKDEYIIGIALGTTYTCAAVLRNNKIELITNSQWKRLIGNAAKNK